MMKFAVVHDLGSLSEEQRKQYLRDASIFLGLDPDLNGLDLIWLNTNEGPSRLTAYARRGTTDILRDIHGITVSDLEQHDGPGYVSFKATGKNKAGRQEIAVGAYAIEGLKGDRIAAAVATAQTRALRRLTLQFVGLAVLDESEVNAFAASPSNPLSQLVLAPPPSVAASNAPGKDITEQIEQTAVNSKLDGLMALAGRPLPVQDTQVSKTQEEFEAYQAKLRADAIASLNESSRRQEMGIEPTHAYPVIEVAQNTPSVANFPNVTIIPTAIDADPNPAAPKKTRKPRSPNKPKVDLGPSEPPKVTSIVPEPEQQRVQTTMIPVSQDPKTQAQVSAVIAITELQKYDANLALAFAKDSIPVTPVVPAKSRLTPEQVKPFRQRLFRVVNDYLEPNGFTPKEGMGNADKMRAFANMMFSDVTNMNELTVEQWEKYLTVLENKIKAEGPAATVKYVEDAIGI